MVNFAHFYYELIGLFNLINAIGQKGVMDSRNKPIEIVELTLLRGENSPEVTKRAGNLPRGAGNSLRGAGNPKKSWRGFFQNGELPYAPF